MRSRAARLRRSTSARSSAAERLPTSRIDRHEQAFGRIHRHADVDALHQAAVWFSPSYHALSAGSRGGRDADGAQQADVKSSPLRQSCRSASSNNVQFMTLSRARLMLCCHRPAQAAQLLGLAARRAIAGARGTRSWRLECGDGGGRVHRRGTGRRHHVVDGDEPAAAVPRTARDRRPVASRARARRARRARDRAAAAMSLPATACLDQLFVARRHVADDGAESSAAGFVRGRCVFFRRAQCRWPLQLELDQRRAGGDDVARLAVQRL